MSLAPGSSLGPYTIVSLLGTGGMGEVYRAKDSRLGRDVAIKVLGAQLAADSTALVRFEREAQALATLSHPGIVAVYDVGHHGDDAYVVMEFLEGETLRARLGSGPLGLRKTLDYAIQIAHALAAAHDRGIVHRDLKPENIFLCGDGRLKVLDFGIVQLASASAALSAETIVMTAPRATAPNTVIGTVGYMAPEQARGQHVDGRADIFSLGAVMYEMLAGRRAFEGDTGVDVLTAALQRDPADLSPDLRVPLSLERIIRRCLEKRPDERFQSARDLAFALESMTSGSGTMPAAAPAADGRRISWWAVVAAGVAALAVGVAAGRLLEPRAPAVQAAAVRFMFDAYRGGQLPEISVSPTGRYLAWTEMTNGGTGGVWIRRMDDTRPTLAIDVMPSVSPFWSSDGSELVVLGPANQLIAIDAASGTRRVLTELPAASLPYRGGEWSASGLVLALAEGIVLTDTSTHTSRQLTRVEGPRESWHGWPSMLPDGTRFVYTVGLAEGGTETRIASLDGGATIIRLPLPEATSRVRVDRAGYLVFAQNRSLLAQQFNASTGALEGTPVRLAPEVFQNTATGWAAADISRNGIVAWRSPGVDEVQFEWVDRGGRTVRSVGEPDAYTNFDLSPDATRIVATRRRESSGSALYLIDSARNLSTPISKEDTAAPVSDPTWSPDGQTIAYRRGASLVIRNVFGGEERELASGATYPDSWSRDGKWLTVGRPEENEYKLFALPLEGGEPVKLVEGVRLADEPRFSPDGKWVAFHGAVQSRTEVFVIPFQPTGERWQLSPGGGVQPRWRADGKELFYLGPDGDVMSVTMPDGNPTKAASPLRLFSLRMEPSAAFDQFTPTADGQMFLVRRPMRPGGADSAPVHVIVNWPDTVRGNTQR